MPGSSDLMSRQTGRARATTHAEIGQTALRLFIDHGFDNVTVDDIAGEVGISRRTLFRYFSSKNDLPWGEFDKLLDQMRVELASMPDATPLMDQLRTVILEFNRVPDNELVDHRHRMDLLLNVPALAAHSTLRYASWRQVIAQHVAHRRDLPVGSLLPQTIAWVCLGACLAAYEQWLADENSTLPEVLGTAFALVDERIDANGLLSPLSGNR